MDLINIFKPLFRFSKMLYIIKDILKLLKITILFTLFKPYLEKC